MAISAYVTLPSTLLETLAVLAEATEQLHQAVQQEEWDEVEALQATRQRLSDHAASLDMPTDEASSLAAEKQLLLLQQANQAITAKVAANQQKLIGQRKTMSRGKKMQQAYKAP